MKPSRLLLLAVPVLACACATIIGEPRVKRGDLEYTTGSNIPRGEKPREASSEVKTHNRNSIDPNLGQLGPGDKVGGVPQ